MKTSLIIDLAGNLQNRARQYSQALTGMARQASGAFGSLRSAAATAGRGLDQIAGRYTAGVAGLGLTYKATRAIMDSAQLDKKLALVAQTGGASVQQAQALRQALFDMARQTGQPIDGLLLGFESLVASGMEWESAMSAIKAINPALAASEASADQLSAAMSVAGNLFNFDLSDLKTSKLLLDQMLVAGRAGNVELKDLASVFSRVGGSAKAAGLSFSQTLAFAEQLSYLEQDPARLATLMDSGMRIFTNQNYLKKAAKATGVDFYDAKGQRREAFAVISDIAKEYEKFATDTQRDKAFATAFGGTDLDTQRFLRELLDSGKLKSLARINDEIANAGGAVEASLGGAINNSVDQVARLKAALEQAADSFAQPINAAITGGINKLLADDKISGKEMLVGAGAAGLAGFGALKLVAKGLQSAGGRFAGGMAQRMAQGAGGLAGLKLPLPVYVVNKQMSLTRDAMLGKDAGVVVPDGGAGKGGKGAKGKSAVLPGGRRARLASGLGRAGGMAMAVNTAIDGYQIVTDDQATIGEKAGAIVDVAGQTAGGWAGAALGAKVGATIGTAIAPGLGTAIGGALGGVVGGIAGSSLAQGLIDAVGSWFGDSQKLDPTVFNEAAQTMQAAAQLMAKGMAVDVNVQGNAQATLTRGNGNVYSGASYARNLATEYMEY